MRKIITFGVFDYFHYGHLRLFQNCKKQGDYLIVAVQNGRSILKYKPNAKIFYSTEERVEIIQALRVVDEVVLYDDLCPEYLEMIDFDILALGEDHVSERFEVAAQWCLENGKEVIRLKRTTGICSSDIKAEVANRT